MEVTTNREVKSVDAAAEASPVVASAIGLGGEKSEWGKLNAEQRDAAVEKAFEIVQERRGTTPAESPVDRSIDREIEKAVAKATESQTKNTEADKPADNDIPAGGDVTPATDDAVKPEDDDVPGDEGEVVVESKKSSESKQDWLDDETRQRANDMGFDDDVLNSMSSREVLDKVLFAFDKKAFEAGKVSAEDAPETEAKKTDDQHVAQQAQKQEQPKTTDTKGRLSDLEQFKLDEELSVEDAKKISDAFAAVTEELKELRAWRENAERREQSQVVEGLRREALNSLHSLGMTDLFGKPGEKVTPEQAKNIDRAIETHLIHGKGLLAAGRNVAPTPAFLKAAVNLAFGDQLTQQKEKQLAEKLRKQSAKRSGGPAVKQMPAITVAPEGETHQEKVARIAKEIESDPVWNAKRAESRG